MMSSIISLDQVPEEYKLVWSDEFEVDGEPDQNHWAYEYGFVRNQELQWYQPDNAFCHMGTLVIEGRRQRKPNPNYQKGDNDWRKNRPFVEYTSSCLTTRGLHSWKYGVFEVKARIKTQNGLWPAIWFLGVEGEWPSCGEIDLMEYYRGNILANACWGTRQRWQPKWNVSKEPLSFFSDPKWDQKFHLWRMKWDNQKITLSVDEILLNTIDLNQTINTNNKGPRNPFHQPHYLLLNLAIGGQNGGNPTQTPFPSRYEIDFVRVYQKTNK
ncbi:uncharacterized protein METZ01_LOCUS186069 [marine metagenome]|uniref:GH16 domain-containing protein n=1 Tax=marine metagenome TaxID=408172 RepID=A0A382D4H9_9ZZZZ